MLDRQLLGRLVQPLDVGSRSRCAGSRIMFHTMRSLSVQIPKLFHRLIGLWLFTRDATKGRQRRSRSGPSISLHRAVEIVVGVDGAAVVIAAPLLRSQVDVVQNHCTR